jgi:hypothetical protein
MSRMTTTVGRGLASACPAREDGCGASKRVRERGAGRQHCINPFGLRRPLTTREHADDDDDEDVFGHNPVARQGVEI